MSANYYTYQINPDREELDNSSPSRKEEGKFELSFNDGLLCVITHRRGGIFNFWLDNFPSFTKFLDYIMLGGDIKAKGGLCIKGSAEAEIMFWESIENSNIPPEKIVGEIYIQKIDDF